MADESRYPLSWPTGWKRTPRYQRERASFRAGGGSAFNANGQRISKSSRALTVSDAIRRLTGELSRLGATNELLSTNVITRLDGLPRSGQGEPDDTGAAVYFKLKGKDRCLACDKWTRTADNIAAIAQHIDALRRIDRYGVGTLDQAFAGYTGLPAKGATWRTTLGFAPDATVTLDEIDAAFRERSKGAHPDQQGGSHDAMASLTAARTEARAELSEVR